MVLSCYSTTAQMPFSYQDILTTEPFGFPEFPTANLTTKWTNNEPIPMYANFSLALKIDSNGLEDSFSPFDPNSSFYNKDLEFDINITLEELMKGNEFFKNGKIQEVDIVQETIDDEAIDECTVFVHKSNKDKEICDESIVFVQELGDNEYLGTDFSKDLHGSESLKRDVSVEFERVNMDNNTIAPMIPYDQENIGLKAQNEIDSLNFVKVEYAPKVFVERPEGIPEVEQIGMKLVVKNFEWKPGWHLYLIEWKKIQEDSNEYNKYGACGMLRNDDCLQVVGEKNIVVKNVSSNHEGVSSSISSGQLWICCFGKLGQNTYNKVGIAHGGDIYTRKLELPVVKAEDIDAIQSDEIPTSSVEGSVIDAIDVQNEVDEIRSAQLLAEEKTRVRDAIRVEIQQKRARLKAHNEAYNAAKTEETAARRLVRLKRQEIDAVQVVINRLKNAMSVEDIGGRILNIEQMIQHETLLLKDEKQFIREIKQLKTLREPLASNMRSPEEIRQAIDQKDQNEERMKTLRKELESLKDKDSKAEAVVRTAGKTYNEDSRMDRELQARFRAADDVRQNAYAQLNSLRKLSYDKNKNFRQFKEDLMAARDFASHGNKDALHRLCANQVEAFMEQWNNNDEFRKEYVSRCNVNASRRQRALDGGPLVPDDVAPVLPGNVNEKVDNNAVSVSIHGEVKSVSVVSSTEKKHIPMMEKIYGDLLTFDQLAAQIKVLC
ncbi:hypothetical protein Hanom_Chr13g01184621 [Helianthus anomalus]